MADIFDVVADPTRRDLLRVLLDRRAVPEAPTGEISVSELVQTLGISQPTVSKHLRVLRDSGLVSVREEGQHRYYRLEPAPLEALDAWVAPFVDDGQDDAGPDGGHADPETGLLGGGLSADPDGEDDGDPSGYRSPHPSAASGPTPATRRPPPCTTPRASPARRARRRSAGCALGSRGTRGTRDAGCDTMDTRPSGPLESRTSARIAGAMRSVSRSRRTRSRSAHVA